MEIVSNNRRRGRPVKHLQSSYKQLKGFRAKTKRGQQNYFNAMKSSGLISQFQKGNRLYNFDFLLNPKFRWTVLAELGRFDLNTVEGQKTMLWVASEISKKEIKHAAAIAFIRSYRLKNAPKFYALSDAINRAINRHIQRFPDTPYEEVKEALNSNLTTWEALNLPITPPSTK